MDVLTIIRISLILNLLLSLLFFFLWKDFRSEFSGGVCFLFGRILNSQALFVLIKTPLFCRFFSIGITNLFFLLSSVLTTVSLFRFFNKGLSSQIRFALIFTVILAFPVLFFYGYLKPDFDSRISAMSILISVPYILTIKLLYSQREESFIPGKLLLFTAIIFVLSLLVRAMISLVSSRDIHSILEWTDSFQLEILAVSVFSSASWPIGFAFLVLYYLKNRAQQKYVENRFLLDFLEKKKQEELEARHQVEQADRLSAIGVLATGMVHEINNPNNCILLNAENLMDLLVESKGLLEEDPYSRSEILGVPVSQLESVVEQMLRGILDSSNRISRLAREIQDYARPRGDEELRFCAIADLTASVQRMLTSKIKKTTDHFRIELAEDLPEIRIQKQRIGQVLLNLVNNALESLQSRSQSVEIRAQYSIENSTVQFIVSDEGHGMSKDDLRHILDPFFTTKESCGGTGLGLPVCERIVMDHRGKLNFHSTPGQGTTVILTLPVDSEKEGIQ